MSIHHFQKQLFNLYVKKSYRDKFITSAYVPPDIELNQKESMALSGIPKKQLTSFAESLVSKKRRIAGKMISANPRLIVVTSAYVDGPALFVSKNHSVININITYEQLKLMEGISSMTLISKNLFYSYLRTKNSTFSDFLRFCILILNNDLWDKKIRIL